MYPHTRIYSVSVSVVFVLIYKNKTGRRQDSKTVNETTSRLLSIAVVSSTAAKFDRFRSNDFWFDRGLVWDGMPCRCWIWLYVKPTPRFIGYFI